MTRNLGVSLIFVIGLSWVFLFHYPANAGPISIGSIDIEAVGEMKKFIPFIEFLAKELRGEGVDQGKVVVAQSIPQMASHLKEGRVDLYVDSAFPSLAVSRLSGSKFLLRRWKKEVGEYHTVIFAKEGSSVSRLEDLKGKLIAFEEPYSTTGYFVPKMLLQQAGLKVIARSDSGSVAPDEISYVFTNADENTLFWVLRDRAVAGAMDNESFQKRAKGHLSSLKILYKSFSMPRQIISYRADLPERLVVRIREILLSMDRSEEGKKVLRSFERTTKFDELPAASLSPFLQAQKLIDAEIGLK